MNNDGFCTIETFSDSPSTRSRRSSSPIKMLSRPGTPKKISGSYTPITPSVLDEMLLKEKNALRNQIAQELKDTTEEEFDMAFSKTQEINQLKHIRTPEDAMKESDYDQFANIETYFKHNPSPLFKAQSLSTSDLKKSESNDSLPFDYGSDDEIFKMDP